VLCFSLICARGHTAAIDSSWKSCRLLTAQLSRLVSLHYILVTLAYSYDIVNPRYSEEANYVIIFVTQSVDMIK